MVQFVYIITVRRSTARRIESSLLECSTSGIALLVSVALTAFNSMENSTTWLVQLKLKFEKMGSGSRYYRCFTSRWPITPRKKLSTLLSNTPFSLELRHSQTLETVARILVRFVENGSNYDSEGSQILSTIANCLANIFCLIPILLLYLASIFV